MRGRAFHVEAVARLFVDSLRAGVVAWDAGRCQRAGGIASRQRARLQAIVEHARTWSGFYADRYAHLPTRVEDVRALPVVTKEELMRDLDGWVTDPAVTRAGIEAFTGDLSRLGELYQGRYFACTTSGTTGRRALLVKDEHELGVLAGLRLARLTPTLVRAGAARDLATRGARIAAVVATGGHFAGVAGVELARRRFGLLRNRARTFSVLKPIPDLVRELNAFQPVAVIGYPTALRALADETFAGRLRIRPAYTLAAGENLSPEDRASLRRAFGGLVQELYAASETLALAYECMHGALHANEDWYVIEPVDEHGFPVPAGVASHTTYVTNLANRVQPVLRYDLGDSVTFLAEPCACASRLPRMRIEGRCDDILQFGDGVRVLPLALGSVIEETPGVARFQATQVAPEALRIRLELMEGADRRASWRAVEERVGSWLARHGASRVAIASDDTPPARDPRSGKFRAVTRDRSLDARASREAPEGR